MPKHLIIIGRYLTKQAQEKLVAELQANHAFLETLGVRAKDGGAQFHFIAIDINEQTLLPKIKQSFEEAGFNYPYSISTLKKEDLSKLVTQIQTDAGLTQPIAPSDCYLLAQPTFETQLIASLVSNKTFNKGQIFPHNYEGLIKLKEALLPNTIKIDVIDPAQVRVEAGMPALDAPPNLLQITAVSPPQQSLYAAAFASAQPVEPATKQTVPAFEPEKIAKEYLLSLLNNHTSNSDLVIQLAWHNDTNFSLQCNAINQEISRIITNSQIPKAEISGDQNQFTLTIPAKHIQKLKSFLGISAPEDASVILSSRSLNNLEEEKQATARSAEQAKTQAVKMLNSLLLNRMQSDKKFSNLTIPLHDPSNVPIAEAETTQVYNNTIMAVLKENTIAANAIDFQITLTPFQAEVLNKRLLAIQNGIILENNDADDYIIAAIEEKRKQEAKKTTKSEVSEDLDILGLNQQARTYYQDCHTELKSEIALHNLQYLQRYTNQLNDRLGSTIKRNAADSTIYFTDHSRRILEAFYADRLKKKPKSHAGWIIGSTALSFFIAGSIMGLLSCYFFGLGPLGLLGFFLGQFGIHLATTALVLAGAMAADIIATGLIAAMLGAVIGLITNAIVNRSNAAPIETVKDNTSASNTSNLQTETLQHKANNGNINALNASSYKAGNNIGYTSQAANSKRKPINNSSPEPKNGFIDKLFYSLGFN